MKQPTRLLDRETFPNDTDVVIRRFVDAAPEKIFAAFTDPGTIDEWWGPDGCATRTESMEAREGGLWKHTMTVADGTAYPNVVRFLELSPPHRIVTETGDKEGAPPWFRTTFTFRAHGAGTMVELRQTWPSKEARDAIVEAVGAIDAGHQTLAHLASLVGDARLSRGRLRLARVSDTAIQLDRVLAATPERIWAVVTDPASIPRWWGPSRYATTVEAMDVRVGGRWRFVQTGDGDERHVFFGEYLEIAPPKRLRQTFVYAPFADFPATETWRLSDAGPGRTLMTVVQTHLTKEALDGMLQGGMEDGANETWSRLERLAAGRPRA